MCKKMLFILIVFALWSTGCGRSGGSGATEDRGNSFKVDAPVSPNDIAFLLPLSDAGRPQPLVTLGTERGIPGNGNFDRVMSAAAARGVFMGDQGNPNNPITDPFNWALVSFRYSPCIFFAGQEKPCKEHVRFVFQPMNQDPTANGGFLDFSFHVTYQFAEHEQATASELMAAVYKLRESAEGLTDNEPLGVHPVLLDRNTRAKYFNDIRNTIWEPFILNRAPTAITFMGLGIADGGGVNLGEWHFLFGLTDESGRWNLELLPDGSGLDVEVLGVGQDDGLLFSNIDDQTEFNILTGRPVLPSAAAGALHPLASNEHNVNCASCHTVDNQILRDTPARLDTRAFSRDQFNSELINIIGEDELGFTNNLTSNEFKGGMFSTANGTPQVGPVAPEDEVVTRMFGYMHSEPVISQRMAFDNGFSVNEMNKVIRMADIQQQNNPLSCTGFNQAFQVMNCLFNPEEGASLNTSLSQCIQSSCQ